MLQRLLSSVPEQTFDTASNASNKMQSSDWKQILEMTDAQEYSFPHPFKERKYLSIPSLLSDVVGTPAFQRLKAIRFLGGIDYVLVPSPNGTTRNARYTRWQHSLGVARLAMHYIEREKVDDSEARTIFVAALLHDVGHAPLSHSLEPVFEQRFGLTHHKATEDIICGRVELGRTLREVLKEYGIDVESVVNLISGRMHDFDNFFGGPINFDTIEGISRSRLYGRLRVTNPFAIVDAAASRATIKDRDTVDDFWNHKNHAYKYIINSRLGVLADFACQFFMERGIDKIFKSDYFITEIEMFRKLPDLKDLLTSGRFDLEVARLVTDPIKYTARTYYVDAKFDFYSRDDMRRYRQSREIKALEPASASEGLASNIEMKSLFDDYTLPEDQEIL